MSAVVIVVGFLWVCFRVCAYMSYVYVYVYVCTSLYKISYVYVCTSLYKTHTHGTHITSMSTVVLAFLFVVVDIMLMVACTYDTMMVECMSDMYARQSMCDVMCVSM